MIRVLLFPVGKPARVEHISGSLESMQKIVGGWIQMVPVGSGLDLVCDEEGKMNGSRPNRFVPRLEDTIHGPFFISKHDEAGDAVSITDADIKNVEALIGPCQ